MKRIVLIILTLFALPLAAAEIEVGVQHVVVSAIGDTGALDIEMSRGFGASAEVFWRDAISTRVSATFVNPAAILYPDNPPPNDVDLGTLGLDTYAATARWHFAPHAKLSGFAGAGGALVEPGNLDDQFGNDVEIEFDSAVVPVAEAGLRYRVGPHIVFELGATYIPLELQSNVRRIDDPRIVLPETIAVDPLVVSAGAVWRF
jgi:hypothetical protein